VKVVDVRGVDKSVQRAIDRRRGAASACRQKSKAATISSSRSTPG
jgi:hypothetical protein